MSKPAVKPIPDGMRSLTPLLTCAGAADAIEALDGQHPERHRHRLPAFRRHHQADTHRACH